MRTNQACFVHDVRRIAGGSTGYCARCGVVVAYAPPPLLPLSAIPQNKPWDSVKRDRAAEPVTMNHKRLTDTQWLLAKRALGVHGRRHRKHDLRKIIDAILFRERNEIAWTDIPSDVYGPWQPARYHFLKWRDSGTLDKVYSAIDEDQRLMAA